jgi:predicted metal-dependent hydrolase
MSNANLSNANFGIDERHPPIKARRVSFTWDDTPLHWIPRDPVATHIINAFHILLPAGERWFIQCVNDALPEITDERLRQEVKGFIGQEMVHARSHQGVLDRLLEKNGIDTRKITDQMNQGIDERPQRKAKLSPRRSRRILMFELAAVAAIEHYTATFGQWLIENDRSTRPAPTPPCSTCSAGTVPRRSSIARSSSTSTSTSAADTPPGRRAGPSPCSSCTGR